MKERLNDGYSVSDNAGTACSWYSDERLDEEGVAPVPHTVGVSDCGACFCGCTESGVVGWRCLKTTEIFMLITGY